MLKYRKEIDGLRGLAVLAIILFHADFKYFKGGFIGVDVFFVISGYLITLLIVLDLEKKQFSLIDFYERRARRLLPALFILLAFSIFFAWMTLPTSDLENFSKSQLSVITFLSNFFFWKDKGGGYFELATHLKPLIHTWSLAVEQQFYLLFPILLLFLWKLKLSKKGIGFIILIFSSISFLFSQHYYLSKPNLTFFLLPARGWEIGIGILSAFFIIKNTASQSFIKINNLLSLAGLILIILPIFLFNDQTTSPGLIIIPILGTVLVILFATQDTLVNKFLASRILVFIGLISYSAYLFHQPIFVFQRYYSPSTTFSVKLILITVSFVFAWLSWFFIEIKFRNKNILSKKLFLKIIIFFIVFFSFINLSTIFILKNSQNFSTEAKIAELMSESKIVYQLPNMNERELVKKRIFYHKKNPEIIILGSSRIMQLNENIPTSKILNLAVSGASIEDDLAIGYLALNKFNPSTIIISADPWLFNSLPVQYDWKFLNDEYQSSFDFFSILSKSRISEKNTNLKKNDNLIKENFFYNRFYKVYNYINILRLESNNDLSESRGKIRPNGSRIYSINYVKKTQNKIISEFDNLLKYGMFPYVPANNSKEIFEDFVRNISKKYRVILVLVPYHPKFYQKIENEREVYLDIEKDFIDLAKKNKINIIGSYNPSKIGCSDGDFYDGMHPNNNCMKKILSLLKIDK
jgi:peptidoglycan/LPS O-acetylase OafA/YrhL